jgi:hypothetical protein
MSGPVRPRRQAPCARGRWPLTIRDAGGKPVCKAVVFAVGVDGLLAEGDVPLRSGARAEVELLAGRLRCPARVIVRRGPGLVFLRFDRTASWVGRDRLLWAVGCRNDDPMRQARSAG